MSVINHGCFANICPSAKASSTLMRLTIKAIVMTEKGKLGKLALLAIAMTLIIFAGYLLLRPSESACVDTNGYWDQELKRCVCFKYNDRGLCKN